MKSLYLPHILPAISLVLATCHGAVSQNLAPNPGFEDYSVCPATYGNGGALECEPWQNGNLATSDFFHSCAVGTDVWVPDNIQGSQLAHTGNGYAGFYTRETSIWREYVQAPLLSACVAGTTYQVSFYVSLADNFCATANIGAHLSTTPPGPANNIGTLNAIPQIEANLGYINNNQDWVLITGCFVAQGGEQWITIGNFYNNANTPMEPGCNTSYASYYYIDDVSVEAGDPGEELDLELGADITTCTANYTIDPAVTGVDFHWSTGETTPTITVDETDVYVLTITSGCSSAIDSVEITFESIAQVQLGPPTLFLCEGETFNVSFDPTLGEYTWQDGSHSPVYTITTPGLYQVTLENACGTSTDEIEITYGDMPAGFSLGDDVALCQGETVSFSFDPGLGDFLWQDGSTSPEYTITGPGSYSLTISNDCGSVSDEILVTLSDGPAVDLGPETINFCEGENINLTYNLDPGAGDYEWQDGSTGASYVINGPGNYSVTVTNECGSTQDEIIVTTSAPPSEFTLGEDTYLCTGQVISFSFDPSLGTFEWQDQSADPNYTIETGGIYQLTITNECGAVADTIVVTESTQPDVDLGQDINLCAGDVVDIVMDPSLGEFLWQDGSTTSYFTISQAGTFAVTVSNACGSDTDAVEVTGVSPVEIDLGPDIVICPSQLPFILDATTPNATGYVWQDNSFMPIYTVTTAGVYTVTVSNECFAHTDQIIVTLEDVAPQVVLPDDITLCNGDTLTLSAGNIVGQYLWQDQSTGSNFDVYQPGSYSLQITNECGSGADTIHVDYIDALMAPDLGPDLMLCPGTQTVLNIHITGADITWQDGSHADSMIVNAAGVYSLQISNSCETLYDSLLVSIDNNPPVLQMQDNITICEGSTVQLDAGISGVSYLWNNGSTTSSIEVSNPGTYSLTVSNSCGSAVDSIVVMSSGNIVSNYLPDSLHLCEGESAMLSPVEQTAISYLWQDGITTASHMISTPGLYILQMTFGCGDVKDSTYVDMLSKVPSFSLGNDTMLCDGASILLSVESNENGVAWQDGSSAEQFLASIPGVYFVTVSNQCNSYTDTLLIDDGPVAPMLDLGPDQSLCPGETILLDPGTANVSFQWSDGSTGSTYSVSNFGTVYLIVENDCGTDADTIEILPDTNGPQIELGDTLVFCEGQMAVIHGDVLGVDYLWNDGSLSQDLHVTTPGEYAVTVSNACGAGSDTVFVEFSGTIPFPHLGADTVLCEGNSLWLFSSAGSDVDIMWQNGSASSSFEVTMPGTFVLTESNRCGNGSDTIVVTYQSLPKMFDLGPDTILCPGEFIELVAPTTADFITWQDGSHDLFLIADETQTYTLEVSNLCGSIRDEIRITIDKNIPVISFEDEISLCQFQSVSLDGTQPFAATYNWSTGSSLPSIVIDRPGVYSVDVSTQCLSVSKTIEVIPGKNCEQNFYIPNIFSPNGDDVNDDFSVSSQESLDISALNCSIFDRWGNEVFHSTDIDFKWNGEFNGKDVPPGVYGYLIDLETTNNDKKINRRLKGDITLVR